MKLFLLEIFCGFFLSWLHLNSLKYSLERISKQPGSQSGKTWVLFFLLRWSLLAFLLWICFELFRRKILPFVVSFLVCYQLLRYWHWRKANA